LRGDRIDRQIGVLMGKILTRVKTKLGRYWRLKLAGGAFVLMTALGIGSAELTSQSWFCNSCHIMNPYYDSWKNGSHKDVACVKCHISPGVDNFVEAKLNGLGQVVDDVLSRTSNKPSASVDQLACMRSGCHTMPDIIAAESERGPDTYKFRHDKHTGLEFRGVKLQCGTCHSHIKGDKHFEMNTSVCITCHLVEKDHDPVLAPPGSAAPTSLRLAVREGHLPRAAGAPVDTTRPVAAAEILPPATCLACHNAPPGVLERNGLKIDHAAFLAYGASCESCHRSVTAVPPPIEDGRCLQCHNFGIDKSLGADEMHRVHSEGRHKIECFSCHGSVLHGTVAQAAMLEQFDCKRCHVDQHVVQRTTYFSNGTTAHPAGPAAGASPMFMSHVDCKGCHIKPRPLDAAPNSGAFVTAAVPEACDACHQKGLGEQMIPLWQKGTRALFDQLTADVAAAQAAGADEKLLAPAREVLQLIRVDGSWGVHNPRYTQQLLEEARAALAQARTPKEAKP
jgi:nitrate/TMAO reductase-like tetraheme cytochrome c subunit